MFYLLLFFISPLLLSTTTFAIPTQKKIKNNFKYSNGIFLPWSADYEQQENLFDLSNRKGMLIMRMVNVGLEIGLLGPQLSRFP
jgi:hypothetical protein